jgi:hypothetical protein
MLATLALATGGVAVAPVAPADVPCTITDFSPRSVTVGLTPITATFKVSTSGCTRTGWDVSEAAGSAVTVGDSVQVVR